MHTLFCCENKQWTELEDCLHWDHPDLKGKDLPEVLDFTGFRRLPSLTLGFDFPHLELYEFCMNRENPTPYIYYGFINLDTDHGLTIAFKHSLDLLDFLKEYAPAFNLLRENFLARCAWEKNN